MCTENLKITYMKTPIYKYTFKNKRIREWMEENCEGKVLNLFAGETKLNVDEVRNDIREEIKADYHLDAFTLVKVFIENDMKFDTIILDPPFSLRKSMEKYEGATVSKFKKIIDLIPIILNNNGIVINWGYRSNVMGKVRNFKQEHILLISPGGSAKDTIAVIERKMESI